MEFKYPKNIEDFDDLLDAWQRKKSPSDENFLEKTVVLDRLFIMDDISGLADRSEAFANILTVSKNLVEHIFIFFIKLTLEDNTGKRYFHIQKHLIFFLVGYKLLL